MDFGQKSNTSFRDIRPSFEEDDDDGRETLTSTKPKERHRFPQQPAAKKQSTSVCSSPYLWKWFVLQHLKLG
jgi:hypothetical protein